MDDAPPAAPRQRLLRLTSRLHDAENDHDAGLRAVRGGVRAEALTKDLQLWRALGAAIVDLARIVREQCAASAFCDARPGIEPLAARLVESIDDQIDAAAWGVIAAQARLLAMRAGE
jgi:hypothetical protein